MSTATKPKITRAEKRHLNRQAAAEKRMNAGAETLQRAVTGNSLMNYTAIIDGFKEKGIPAEQITPRENVFTYNAWLKLGRQVRKGEKGVKVVTYRDLPPKTNDEGEIESLGGRKLVTATVFHVSQTDPIEAQA